MHAQLHVTIDGEIAADINGVSKELSTLLLNQMQLSQIQKITQSSGHLLQTVAGPAQ